MAESPQRRQMCMVFLLPSKAIRCHFSYAVFTEAVTKACPGSRSGGSGEVLQEHVEREVPLRHLREMQSATGEANPGPGDGWRPRQLTQPAAIVGLGSGGRLAALKPVVDTSRAKPGR